MNRYRVTVPLHAAVVVELEATSVDEAIAVAIDEAASPSLCHQCASKVEISDLATDKVTEDMVTLVEEAETKVERQHALIISMADLLRECVVKLEECTADGRIARPVHLLDRLSLLLQEGEEG